MIIKWERFLPYIEPWAPSCPSALIEQTLIDRAAHFCERTQLWRADINDEVTEAGEATYALVPPDAVVDSVLWIRLDGADLPKVSDLHVSPEYFFSQGKPQAYALELDRQVRFFPVPDAVYAFSARVVLKPSRSARGVEEFIFNAHAPVIASGVLADLLAMPAKNWTDLPLAAVHEQKFAQGLARARVRDFRNVPLRVTPQPF